jgi:hypothetical protein
MRRGSLAQSNELNSSPLWAVFRQTGGRQVGRSNREPGVDGGILNCGQVNGVTPTVLVLTTSFKHYGGCPHTEVHSGPMPS